ncbi:hypothetical protein GCM10025882_05620 [Acinetobacter gyllenbergii]|uniref:Uncharacterized protein n=1 Tax=Acinetobacter gyllenbergii CIP 110306 = MTCC 11365 TaxID=1217657 RepID=A0A829HKL3_9GAMM|nr:hypothetical protein [Acinetobacter gyllenbergii]EPF93120.1 hypothetical protein F957_00466 [Acinetobacter gyllenbergii CIP 110306 = MTCC 11365]EPH31430.1 hypothetical protein L293_2245 [Acinetobacter gyllenbergii CIP 110306 = MTCC 11365]MCU4579733.1 hypothetical protein [Acinetobacter gyllenbergii]GMA10138.1 hypothetical protein GCM10025882_05620 [Acinetobacter gyllenbergii]
MTLPKNYYRIDIILTVIHAALLLISWTSYTVFPFIRTKPDMSGLFFMIISILGGMIALILLAVVLPRLDQSVSQLALKKFLFALLYWISSSIIFILFGNTLLLFNQPLPCILIFSFIFLGSIYLSVIRFAHIRKQDYFIVLGIFGFLFLFFFCISFS